MIRVVIFKYPDGTVRAIDITGHAGYGKKGQDIVCAAVSAIAYTVAGALEELAGLKRCHEESDGHMIIRLPRGEAARSGSPPQVILETAVIGFKQLEFSYGKYVTVVEREVLPDDQG